ncbi:MAG: hypothetical protein JSW70_07280 [Syntrophobacterales bacterium]|nr:MAG: hypothetical protein JSW70_07280 [Syntrophobacterales bacterium]
MELGVDLSKNMKRWRDRLRVILRQNRGASGTIGSLCNRGQGFWKRTDGGKLIINPGRMAMVKPLEMSDCFI